MNDTTTQPKFRRDRFERLIAAVKAPKAGTKWEMASWARRVKSNRAKTCPTAACAAGHYVLAHPRCGLKLNWAGAHVASIDNGSGFGSLTSLAEHFGIDRGEAGFLFEPSSYTGDAINAISRRTVLSRLRAFLAAKLQPEATR